MTVACYTGGLVDNSLARLSQPVEQGGFSHIGSSDDGDNIHSFIVCVLFDSTFTNHQVEAELEIEGFRVESIYAADVISHQIGL